MKDYEEVKALVEKDFDFACAIAKEVAIVDMMREVYERIEDNGYNLPNDKTLREIAIETINQMESYEATAEAIDSIIKKYDGIIPVDESENTLVIKTFDLGNAIKVGEKVFKTGLLDVTDPCYDRDTFCRTQVAVVPQTYEAFVTYRDERIATLILLPKNRCGSSLVATEIATIGVDAGLAGFFEDKPDYSDEEWFDLCKEVFRDEDYGMLDCGFWSQSGYGDGEYPVYIAQAANTTLAQAVVIEFIPEEGE